MTLAWRSFSLAQAGPLHDTVVTPTDRRIFSNFSK